MEKWVVHSFGPLSTKVQKVMQYRKDSLFTMILGQLRYPYVKKGKYHIQKLTQIGPFLNVKPIIAKLLEESIELGMWPWIR